MCVSEAINFWGPKHHYYSLFYSWHGNRIPIHFTLVTHRDEYLLAVSDRDVCASMDLYRRYAGFLPASKGSAMLSQSKHWFGGCRVCRTCSAAPDSVCHVYYLHVCVITLGESHNRAPIGGPPYKPAKEGSGRSFKCFHF